MYFKQIDMVGFKSFADETVLNLTAGITAIVGPNGCGKSNILDALRWCLGEQRAKALRGSHMQDVIFNGSEHRSAMGMAEVTLTFDNADQRLPIDFAEVQVTRRVYRSGESEYLINKAPCRLMDIQEVFMDTGIGTNAYSLIGQGKIDMVLSSRPEDRRYLFEEAAGIIKYKTRKRVAMRKLDGASQNLVRLHDIVAEVQRQMRNLKRQVNAAIRHRELTEALRELEIRNAWLHFNELSGQIEDLKTHFGEAQDRHEKLQTVLSQKEARLEELNLAGVELERVLLARRDGEHQLDSELERLENSISLLRKEIEFAHERREAALREHEELKERAGKIHFTQGESDGEALALEKRIVEADEELEARQRAYDEAAQQVAQAEEALEALRTQAVQSINSRNRVQTDLETIGVSLNNIDTQLENIYSNQETQDSRRQTLSAQLEELQAKQAELSGRVEEKERAQQEAEEEKATLTERLRKQNEEWQGLRERKSSQEARLASLRELRDSYEGFAVGVRAVMKAKQNDLPEAAGIVGPVGDLVSTEKRYERAVEAALGGNINNVVVEEADSAKAAIEFLKRHRAGRVTFLPLDTIRSGGRDYSDSLRGMPGVIGSAIEFVQAEGRLRPALEYLFYNTVIVETIDDAIRIARSEQRFPRLVTLDGEMVSSAGAVTGGRTQHESRGILGRSAEIEELEQGVVQAERRIGQLAQEATALQQRGRELEETIRQSSQAAVGLRRELNEVGTHVTRTSTEVESLNQSGRELGTHRDKLLTQREELETRRKDAQARIEQLTDEDASQEQRVADAQAQAAQTRQQLSARSDALTELRVHLAELRQQRQEAERNRQRELQAHAETVREAERRLEMVKEMEVKVKDAEAGIADNVERIQAMSETREDAHKKVLEAQQKRQAAVEEMEGLTKGLKQLRQEAGAAQKEVHKLELELSHKEERVGFFQDRILEEYQLALASLSEDEVGTDEYDEQEREKLIKEHRRDLQRLGSVNLMAIDEYEALEKREAFLLKQQQDLQQAHDTLLDVVARIDSTIRDMFMETFNIVEDYFKTYFRRLFNGGQARIYLVDENDPLESGIEIEARPPGKKPQSISLLSGGEQAMTAIALLFSIFSAKPSPFCVLDEVDAPLDDANIGRFLALVEDFVDRSQFIIITHNKQTMAKADALFGVTQQERGVSQLVSVRFEDVEPAGHAA